MKLWASALLLVVLGSGSMATVPDSDARACASPAVQEPAPACKKCGNTGRLACGEHPKSECELEDAVVFCGVIADCAVCGGTGFTPCTECKNEAARAALEKKKGTVAARKVALKVLDDKMERPLRKAESAHFVLVFELEKIKVDKKVLNAHEATHLYLKRLEELYADYLARLSVTPRDFAEKFRVFVWSWPQDHHTGSLHFCGQNASGGVKLLGQNPTYSVCGNRQNFGDDEKLHRNIVHSVTHLLLSAQNPIFWIGNVKGGWADEGLAHWFEDRYWGICDNYCYQEANTNVDFKSGKYRLAVRRMIEMDKVPAVGDVFEKNIDTLTLPEHAVSFSYVDYFLARDGAKFTALVKELKKKVATRDALKKVYEMSPLEFEALWKAWVLATYPTK